MKEELKIRLEQELKERLKEYCEKQSYRSLNECVTSIISMFVYGTQDVSDVIEVKGGKVITYFGRERQCSRCKKTIRIGDKVYYVRYKLKDEREEVVFLCYDCYAEVSDSTIANLIKKREKLKLEVKILKQEHEKYLTILQQLEQIQSVLDIYIKFRDTVEKAMYDAIQKDEDLKAIYSSLVEKLEDIARELDETIKINKIIWLKLKKMLFKREAEQSRVKATQFT
jgi:hypothetical protein